MNGNSEHNSNFISDINNLLRHFYLPYWPIFLMSLVLFLGLGFLYTQYITPSYDITASILIKDETKSANNDQPISTIDIFESNKIVDNEKEILHSSRIMNEVVEKLRLYAPISEMDLLHLKPAYSESPVIVEAMYPDSIKDSKPISFSFDNKSNLVNLSHHNFPINTFLNTKWGKIRFERNPYFKETNPREKMNLFFTLESVQRTTNALLSRLTVETSSKLSTVINLTLRDNDRAEGQDILNQLISFYKYENLLDKSQLASNALSFLEGRLRIVSSALDSIEGVLQTYKSSAGVVDLGEQGKLILGSEESNDQKISNIDGQVAILKQIEGYIEGNGGNPGIIPTTTTSNDEVLSKYLGNLYEAQIQFDKLRKTTAQNNPILVSLQDEISKIKPTILQYVGNQINVLQTERANLNSNSKEYSSALKAIPGKERTLLEMTRQQEIKNQLYTFLLQKREEAALSYSSTVTDIRMVNNPIASIKPVSPNKSRIYPLAMVLGFLFPILILSIKKKVLIKNDISKILDFPIIGEISYAGNHTKLIDKDNKMGYILEQFRQVRSALPHLLSSTNTKKRILITSSIAGEGKSFVTSNLGMNLASAGKKVVLIDLDLYKSRLSKLLDHDGSVGISEFLVGKAEISDIIHKTSRNKNLFIVPAGKIPFGEVELTMNKRFDEILGLLDNNFDFIIIETAPANLISDAYLVSDFCDASIFVVRYKTTPIEELWAFKENQEVRKLKNPAIVFNAVRNIPNARYRNKYYSYVQKHDSI